MWAPGSRLRGFTLLELLLVVAIIAMASAGVGFALRGQDQAALEREAQRLVALLEAARAQSRTSGLPVFWQAREAGFAFVGLPAGLPLAGPVARTTDAGGMATTTAWMAPDIAVAQGAALVLGPEPIIGAQHVDLLLAGRSLRIGTDGLRPFAVLEDGRPASATP